MLPLADLKSGTWDIGPLLGKSGRAAYKHQVLPNESNTVRYSITLRSVHWTNFNSTYAVGDSNFGGIEFGSGRGKVERQPQVSEIGQLV